MIKNKRIVITGGAGSIGSELVRQLAHENKIFVLDINESDTVDLCHDLEAQGYWVKPRIADVRDKEVIADLFADFKPEYIFMAHALKHVPVNETYPLEAIKTNEIGTYNIIHEAKRYECLEKLVYISTDKVVHATSVMGATKHTAEIMVRNAGGTAVRFGNVIGSRGSLLTIWDRQFAKGEPITVTDERMERYFMSIKDACELVIEAATKKWSLAILDMGKQINILGLAKLYVAIKGKPEHPIEIIGKRQGEVISELLMSEEEEKLANKIGKFYVIN